MKYSEAKQGRIFIIRWKTRCYHQKIEAFADEKGIHSGALIIVGGADKGSKLVVGPADGAPQRFQPWNIFLVMFMK